MTEQNEVTILEDGNVKITNLRAIIGSKTYAMSNVTSVSMTQKEPGSAPLWLIISGLSFAALGLMDIKALGYCLGLGIVLAALGFFAHSHAKPLYSVRIGSASGETNVLESIDQVQIRKIVDAMNDAIVRRG